MCKQLPNSLLKLSNMTIRENSIVAVRHVRPLLCITTLFQSYRTGSLPAQAAAHHNVLRVRGPREFTTVATTTFVLQGSDQGVGRSDVDG